MSICETSSSWLAPGQLAGARKCAEYGRLAEMHLSKESEPDHEKRNASRNYIVYSLMEGSPERAVKLWDTFIHEIYPSLPGASRQGAEMEDFLVKRFFRWYFDQGYKEKRTCFRSSFQMGGREIRVDIDLELEKDGKILWLNIDHKKSESSEKAKIEAKKTGNSLELLAMMAAAEESGLEADCMIAHLKSKDDTADEKDPEFEKGKGKNLEYLSFQPDARKRLEAAMELPEEKDCDSCGMRDLCRANELIEETEEVPEFDLDAHLAKTRTIPSDSQQRVIDHRDGPMAVIAVAGGGKTRTLTERYLKMVKEGIRADSILFLTFTRKAAAELTSRLRAVASGKGQVQSFTFHSFFTMLLKEYGEPMDMKYLATSTKKKKLIVEALDRCETVSGLSYEYMNLRYGTYDKLLDWFEKFKRQSPEEVLHSFKGSIEGVLTVYQKYSELFYEAGYFDYEDIVARAGKLLSDPEIRQKVHSRWPYIMVDEYQDINDEIAAGIYRMAAPENNLVVVGDDDQGIYAFNGGDSRHILEFRTAFPDAEIVFMEENYRSTPEILSSAQSLITHNPVRYDKTLHARKQSEGKRPEIITGLDSKRMADFIAQFKSYAPEEIAILGRNNQDLECLGARLLEKGISCLPPRKYLTDTEEFKSLRCFLKYYLFKKKCPGTYLYRLLRYAGVEDIRSDRIFEEHFQEIRKIPECISDASVEAEKNCRSIPEKIERIFLALSAFSAPTISLKCLCDRIADECCGTLPDVLRLFDEMERYHDTSEVEVEEKKGSINLVTSHKAKGKEYRCVIINGVEKYRDEEEERRLLYVSMTRAKERLILVQTKLDEEAPLLSEIEGLTDFNNG